MHERRVVPFVARRCGRAPELGDRARVVHHEEPRHEAARRRAVGLASGDSTTYSWCAAGGAMAPAGPSDAAAEAVRAGSPEAFVALVADSGLGYATPC